MIFFLGLFAYAPRKSLSCWPLHCARKPHERALLYPTYSALLGAWVGVIPIGLDWDRPWQLTTARTPCLRAVKLARSLEGISSHPSSWCIAWLYNWSLTRAWREHALVLCRRRSDGFFWFYEWAGEEWHKGQEGKQTKKLSTKEE